MLFEITRVLFVPAGFVRMLFAPVLSPHGPLLGIEWLQLCPRECDWSAKSNQLSAPLFVDD